MIRWIGLKAVKAACPKGLLPRSFLGEIGKTTTTSKNTTDTKTNM